MNRYDAREHAFALIFSLNFQDEFNPNEQIEIYCEAEDIESDAYFVSVVKTACERLSEIDEMISAHLKNWSISRISKVSLAALRLGVCEMIFIEETPAKVAINEAVNLAKKFEDIKCSQFVNGVLSSIMNEK